MNSLIASLITFDALLLVTFMISRIDVNSSPVTRTDKTLPTWLFFFLPI